MAATQSGFGEWLRRHRLASGLSQEERAGLSVRGISELERGIRRKPQRETVRLLAEALKLPEREWRPFDKHSLCRSLEVIACIEAARGRKERAIRVWAAADALRESIGIPPSVMERSHYEPCMLSTRSEIHPETWSVLWEEGRMMSPEQAVEYALANPQ